MGSNNVARFAQNQFFDKPMLINQSTNMKRLQKLTGSRFLEDWANLDLIVTLQAEWDKHPKGGYEWGLRIGKTAPSKPTLKENTQEWNAVLGHVKKGNDPKGS